MYNIYQKYRSIIIILVKLLILTAAFYFVSQKIVNAEMQAQGRFLQQLKSVFFSRPLIVFTVLSFTLANWFFEILKWKTLVSTVKSISFYEAFQQSTSSLTASLLTPNRIGEYGAKAIYYAGYQRKKVMFLNLISNLSQMFITVVFGLIGFLMLYESFSFSVNLSSKSIYLFVFLAVLMVLIFYIFKDYILHNFVSRIMRYFKQIPKNDLRLNIQYSLFRYLIFSHQFYFLLMVFGVNMDYFTAMGAIFSVYFIASIIPGIVVFDFIVKGSIAISVFGLFGVSELLVLTVTTIMWMLNFALPAIIGSYFVFVFELPSTAKVTVK